MVNRLNIQQLAEKIVNIANECSNETELRIKLKPIFDELLKFAGFSEEEINKIERHEQRIILKHKAGRVDTLYGNVIIEFKAPGYLESNTNFKKAIEQLKDYLEGYVEEHKIKEKHKVVGVLFDGLNIAFLIWRRKEQDWKPSILYRLNAETLAELIDIFRGLVRKPLNVKEILDRFGQKSEIAKKLILTFYKKLENPSDKTKLLFKDWKRVFSYVAAYSPEAIKELGKYYGLKDANPELLFFAIHTYYALFMKLLSAELVSLFVSVTPFSFLKSLEDAYRSGDIDKFKEELERLENGHIFKEVGIRNYLEGDYFSWYLNEFDEELAEAIYQIIKNLSIYEPTIIEIDRKVVRDLFKELYEDLVPKEIRHNLGEYYTDDWVAELLLDKIGWSVEEFEKLKNETGDKMAPLKLVLLDPACGSGTFLVLAIQRLREYAEEYLIAPLPPSEILNAILNNIIGFDLNPLATLAARSNYLLAISDLLRHVGRRDIEIPIYMADSLLSEEERTLLKEDKTIPVYILETEAGKFEVPVSITKQKKALSRILEIVEQGIEWGKLPRENFIQRILSPREKYKISKEEAEILGELYDKILELEEKNLDKIWTRIIKNAFAPLLYLNKADFIVGNPPWLAFRYVGSLKYQEKLKSWIKDKYKLTEKAELITHMELATLFFVRVAELYLKPNGKIGFVMPRSIFSADQHKNFRELYYLFEKEYYVWNNRKKKEVKEKLYLKFEYLIDLEKVEPLFNVPSCVLIAQLSKDKTEYPIKGLKIKGKLPKKNLQLNEAKKYLKIEEVEWYLYKVGERTYIDVYKPDDIIVQIVEKIKRRSPYYDKFSQGATIVPRVFWFVDILKDYGDKVYVKSSQRAIKQAKSPWKNVILEGVVEKKFIYNVYTSTELVPFGALEPNYAILPIEPANNNYRIITKEEAFTKGYEGLAKWLHKCEEYWKKYGGKTAQKANIYQWLNWQNKLTKQNPNAKYIVVYPAIAKYILSSVIKIEKTCSIVIDHKLYFYETINKEEAYYLTSIFNSHLLNELIKKMKAPRNEIHKKPLEFYIPKFNEEDSLHLELAKLGMKTSEKVQNEILPEIVEQYKGKVITLQIIGRIRNQIREKIKSELERINELTIELFRAVAKKNSNSSILDYLRK